MGTNTLEGVSASPSYWKRFLKIVLGVFVVLLILLIILATVITLTSEIDYSTDREPEPQLDLDDGLFIPTEPVE